MRPAQPSTRERHRVGRPLSKRIVAFVLHRRPTTTSKEARHQTNSPSIGTFAPASRIPLGQALVAPRVHQHLLPVVHAPLRPPHALRQLICCLKATT